MGLSVVHGLAKEAGGTVEVQSRAGEGSTFCVYLPLLREELPKPSLDLGLGAPEQTRLSLRLLVVDDEASLVEMLRQQLVELGCQVTAVTTPEAALAKLFERSSGFDLVITDMTMPHATGSDLLRAIREFNATIPVVLISGHHVDNASQDGTPGFIAYLRKPVLFDDLAEVLRQFAPKP
jgi:CheY-like chemotaxis protein